MGFFTHPPSDYPSLLLWFLDETHVTVTAGTAAVILWTRDAHAVWFATGALLSTIVARVVKHAIKQPRPPPPPPQAKRSPVRPKKTFGFPSTHSTALGFYFTYLLPLLPLVATSPLGTAAEYAALTGITGLGLWSRVELGYHTVPQVIAGAAVGTTCALGWAKLWDAFPAIQPALQDAIDRCVALVF